MTPAGGEKNLTQSLEMESSHCVRWEGLKGVKRGAAKRSWLVPNGVSISFFSFLLEVELRALRSVQCASTLRTYTYRVCLSCRPKKHSASCALWVLRNGKQILLHQYHNNVVAASLRPISCQYDPLKSFSLDKQQMWSRLRMIKVSLLPLSNVVSISYFSLSLDCSSIATHESPAHACLQVLQVTRVRLRVH